MSTTQRPADADARRWELTAQRYSSGRYMDPLLAEQFRRVHRDLVQRWWQGPPSARVLKTDAFAAATCPARAFSWDVCPAERLVCAEISPGLASAAHQNAVAHGHGDASYVTGDVRGLPFADEAFDLVVSDSTLDHFETTGEIHVSLRELARVLKPGGTLIITLDNPSNLGEPPFRLWLWLGRGPYFIGRTLSRRRLCDALRECGLEVTANTAILHNPRFFAKAAMRLLRATGTSRLDRMARRGLRAMDSMEQWPTRYLTGQFVAARAIKPASRTQAR